MVQLEPLLCVVTDPMKSVTKLGGAARQQKKGKGMGSRARSQRQSRRAGERVAGRRATGDNRRLESRDVLAAVATVE